MSVLYGLNLFTNFIKWIKTIIKWIKNLLCLHFLAELDDVLLTFGRLLAMTFLIKSCTSLLMLKMSSSHSSGFSDLFILLPTASKATSMSSWVGMAKVEANFSISASIIALESGGGCLVDELNLTVHQN